MSTAAYCRALRLRFPYPLIITVIAAGRHRNYRTRSARIGTGLIDAKLRDNPLSKPITGDAALYQEMASTSIIVSRRAAAAKSDVTPRPVCRTA